MAVEKIVHDERYIITKTPSVLKRFWTSDHEKCKGVILVLPKGPVLANSWGGKELVPEDRELTWAYKNPIFEEGYEYHPEWLDHYVEVEEPGTVFACTCPSISSGCTCGAFANEMVHKGFFWNPVTRKWDRNDP